MPRKMRLLHAAAFAALMVVVAGGVCAAEAPVPPAGEGAVAPSPPGAASPSPSPPPPAEPVPDIQELVRILREHQKENNELLERYSFILHGIEEQYKPDGSLRERAERKIRVVPRKDGPALQRLLEVDGRAPTEAELRKWDQAESRRLARARERDARSRQAREEDHGLARTEEEEDTVSVSLQDLLAATRFETAGWEEHGGRRCVRVEMYPEPEARVSGAVMKVVRTLRGTFWVDPVAGQVLKAEAATTAPTSVLGGIAKVKEVSFTFENQLVRGELWFPRATEFEMSLRAGFRKERYRSVQAYSDFEKAVTEVDTFWEMPGENPAPPAPPAGSP